MAPTQSLPPFTEKLLGPARAARALALRKRLGDAGVALPAWIDARPGRLRLVLGDLADDPPLSRTAAALAEGHGDWLLAGLGALQLAAAAPAAALHAPPGPPLAALRRAAAGTRVRVHEALPVWPSRPELDLPGAFGRAWVCSPALLDRAAAAVNGAAPKRLCTVAGAVRAPAVLPREVGEPPRSLLMRAGGAAVPAWVAIAGGAPGGRLWDPDAPLPEDVPLLLVLPAAHPLVRGLRQPAAERLARAAAACLGCRLCSDACPEPTRGAPLLPHRLVPLLGGAADPAGRGAPREDAYGATLLCTGCGACDAVCPHGLGPAGLIRDAADRLRAAGHAAPPLPLLDGPRAAPVRLSHAQLAAALGLSDYALEGSDRGRTRSR